MDPAAMLAALDTRLRAPAGERVGSVVRRVATGPGGWDGVEFADLDGDTADAAIAEQVAYFRSLGRGFEWKYYSHDRPADLPHRLRTAGFREGAPETVMVAPADAVTAAQPPVGSRIVEVTDAAGLALVGSVHSAAFGTDSDDLAAALADPVAAGTTIAVLVLAGPDEPVCAARLDLHPGTGFASLWGGGTVPAWRGRGLYRATVAHRAALARARGYRLLRTDAVAASRPILLRPGFVPVATTVPFTHGP